MARLGGDEFAILMPGAASAWLSRVWPSCASSGQSAMPMLVARSGPFPATFHFFEPVLAARIRDRRALEHDLRHAVERGELQLADGEDAAGLLGDRDEQLGRDGAALGMVPAQQRLATAPRAGGGEPSTSSSRSWPRGSATAAP
jgi:hypothetical protein